jgi:hypothetical protein
MRRIALLTALAFALATGIVAVSGFVAASTAMLCTKQVENFEKPLHHKPGPRTIFFPVSTGKSRGNWPPFSPFYVTHPA